MKDQYKHKLSKNMIWFNRILDNISEEQLQTPVQDSGDKWTAIQVLRHIAYSELSIVKLIENILDGKDEVPKDYSLKDANRKGQEILKEKGMDSIRNRMEKSRVETLNLLEKLNEDDWNREGIYFTGDTMTVRKMFEILIWHQSHHGKTITDVIDTSTWN